MNFILMLIKKIENISYDGTKLEKIKKEVK